MENKNERGMKKIISYIIFKQICHEASSLIPAKLSFYGCCWFHLIFLSSCLCGSFMSVLNTFFLPRYEWLEWPPPPLPFSFWGAGWGWGGRCGVNWESLHYHYHKNTTSAKKKCGTGCPRIDYDSWCANITVYVHTCNEHKLIWMFKKYQKHFILSLAPHQIVILLTFWYSTFTYNCV